MGMMIDGQWLANEHDFATHKGAFIRAESQMRNQVVPAGHATTEDASVAAAGRYQLYVSLACPWAHRTLIMRTLKGLEALIPVAVVSPEMLQQGWSFATASGSSGEPLYNLDYLHQLYRRHDPHYSGRVTVPVLWDRQREQIVNNESSDIMRIFNSAFDSLTGNRLDFYPQALRPEIDRINERVYRTINNGVYRAGFASTQAAYEEACRTLFDALDDLEQRLRQQSYLAGQCITEADWRLFTTLIRFDAVYHGHFKCNLRTLESYPELSSYLRALYQWPGIAETVDFTQIKRHYYFSHSGLNPSRIVPLGPELDFSRPHDRARFNR